jgi:glycosyltransferase involved in cell wall biosynthesis
MGFEPRRFGTIYPFVESRDSSLKMGRLVANFEFLKALLEFGSFDEYFLFSPDAVLQKLLKERLQCLNLSPELKEKIKHYLYFDLKKVISALEFEVFHLGGFGYFMPGLAYIRNNHAKNQFPITGITLSLNGHESPYHFLKLARAPFGPQDRLICISEAGKRVSEKFLKATEEHFGCTFKGELVPLPLGIDESHFIPRIKADARLQLGWDPAVRYLLSIGRLTPALKMDFGPVFTSLRRLKKETSIPFKAVFAGGNSGATAVLQSMVDEFDLNDCVEFKADFSDDEKHLLYSAADIYLSLVDNFQETFGLSVVEAMAHGLPCVVSDFDGYKELLADGTEGFKIKTIGMTDNSFLRDISEVMNFPTVQLLLSQNVVVDLDMLRERLTLLIEDASLCNTMGYNARRHAQASFGWSKIIKDYELLWSELQAVSKRQSPVGPLENPFEIEYLNNFSSYFSEQIDTETLFELTQEGRAVLMGGPLPGKYTDLHLLLVDELMIVLLNSLNSPGKRLGSLLKQLQGQNIEIESSFLEMHLMWMAKYGLIAIKSS